MRLADDSAAKGERGAGRQSHLVKETGLKQSQISETLRGIRKPSVDLVMVLADYLGRSVDSILGVPMTLDSSQLEHFARHLEAGAAGELYRALHVTLFGKDTIENASRTTTPTLPPPQLPPHGGGSAKSSDTNPDKATKRKRPRKSTR